METCKTCYHRIKATSGKGIAQYCDIHYSKLTKNGHLKIKINQPCCQRYEEGMGAMQKTPDNQLSLFD